MAGYTYTSLKQAIQDYTDNDESVFVSQLDSFIQSTEERILKTAPLEVFRKNASATITSSNKYVPKPSDWLYTYSLSVQPSGVTKFLLNKDVNFIQEYWPDPTATGEPKYYADFDVDNFIVAPTPDSAYTAELHYFYRPVSLTDDASGVTWLSENAGPAMLYGSLVEAYTFMKGEPDMITQYENFFQAALQRINGFAQSVEGLDFYRRTGA
jgi:hypothetical protein